MMLFNATWTYNDLANWFCDALVQRGRLRTKPAFIREDREAQLAALFESIQLDGAALTEHTLMRGIPQLAIRVREATHREPWVADVIEILSAIGRAADHVLPAVTTPSPSAWHNMLPNSVLPNPLFPPIGFEAFLKLYTAMCEMHVSSSCNVELITKMPIVHNLAGKTMSSLTSVPAPLTGGEVRRQVAVACALHPEQCVLLDGCQQINDCDEINVDECVSLTFISMEKKMVKVWVEDTGFPYILTENDVHKAMSRYGVVSSVKVENDELDAIVEFAETDAAIRARDDLSGNILTGRVGTIRVVSI